MSRKHHAPKLLVTAVSAFALTTTATASHAADYPGFTVSHYVQFEADSSQADTTRARKAGCAAGGKGRDGPRFLFLGTQEKDQQLRPAGTRSDSPTGRVPTQRAVAIAEAWSAGFTECRTNGATARLALAVNNKEDGAPAGSKAGGEWAALVDDAANAADNAAVTVIGGWDAEPDWSSPSWARAWVKGFTQRTDRQLYAANAASGCPTYGSSSVSCSNGWDLSDMYHVSSGAAPTVSAVPQIYRTDGVQAQQWAAVSSWGAQHGKGPLRFAGSLSQRVACEQRGDCTGTDNTAKAAWNQLRTELNSHTETEVGALPAASDVRWW
ncbi:hypothetical protein FHX37_1524 [Haloactinospora alba]|uniref:Uncharacterized protein n=1 Tax=Haloactinospora alba TaxID=405555 RepID=A0A543NIE6_9ACTN|nr:hypothetical protein [Haloactinospora alba]TQN31616.1 hypothetical protein FHX37_1524 [Haloactinospora alba]